jgi:hypothetical protein
MQTPEYATAMLTAGARHLETPHDIEPTVALRMERQRVLYQGDHLFHVVLCEPVLRAAVAPVEVMAGQLDRLLEVSVLPRVHLGVLPMAVPHPYPPMTAFWIHDDREVQMETLSAQITVTQPREIALYVRAFAAYARVSVYGREARSLISAALHDLQQQSAPSLSRHRVCP